MGASPSLEGFRDAADEDCNAFDRRGAADAARVRPLAAGGHPGGRAVGGRGQPVAATMHDCFSNVAIADVPLLNRDPLPRDTAVLLLNRPAPLSSHPR